MKILLDTNILVPLEPASKEDAEHVFTDAAMDLSRLATEMRHQLYVHPLSLIEFTKDQDSERSAVRASLLRKYPVLPNPPKFSLEYDGVPSCKEGSHDWIDCTLLIAIKANAVDFLVTQDKRMMAVAGEMKIRDRVFSLIEMIEHLSKAKDYLIVAGLPQIRECYAHELDSTDPIFESLRSDYGISQFDAWLNKCKREQRHCYTIEEKGGIGLAGICILNQENGAYNLGNKVLKICTFKIADNRKGLKYGELLLKAVFEYCKENRFDAAFITMFEDRQKFLLGFMGDFGFLDKGIDGNQRILGKRFSFTDSEKARLGAFDFHREFGPWVTKFENNSTFLIPIQPKFYNRLFPENAEQGQLLSEPFGNGIRKAYLSNSKIGGIKRGDNLLFYRSQDDKAIKALGVVEDVRTSSSIADLESFVYKITVFEKGHIWALASKGVLAIKFRRVKFLEPELKLDELKASGVLKQAPQTIMRVGPEGLKWLIPRMGL